MATYSGEPYTPDWRMLLLFTVAMAGIGIVCASLAWSGRNRIGTDQWVGFFACILMSTSTLALAVIGSVDSYNWSPLGSGLAGESLLDTVTYWSASIAGLLILATQVALLPSIRRAAAAREAAIRAMIRG